MDSAELSTAELSTIIDAIERPDFFARTEIASTHNAVVFILSRTLEIQTLCEQKEKSVLLLLARYEATREDMPESVRLIYFVLFGLLRDKRASELIIAYLQTCRNIPGEEMHSPWHPFRHAINALSFISNRQDSAPKTIELILGFDHYLSRIGVWNE
jgi:hypothetical protein